MKLPQIVGISGTNGAGKDELGILLSERQGYHFHSVTDLLRQALKEQGKEVSRENLSALSKQWRNESGDGGIMFTRGVEAYLAEKDDKGYSGVALASIRHPDEVDAIHHFGGIVVWIDADQRSRYERVTAGERGRSEDLVTFDQFKADEEREMNPPADAPAGTLNMAAVRDVADIKVLNNFSSVDEYRDYLIGKFEL